jgi:hypothetical protein
MAKNTLAQKAVAKPSADVPLNAHFQSALVSDI